MCVVDCESESLNGSGQEICRNRDQALVLAPKMASLKFVKHSAGYYGWPSDAKSDSVEKSAF